MSRLNELSEMGCVVCWREWRIVTPPEIHHLRGHPWSGAGQRASDEHTIPLCPHHHRHGAPGEVGYHQSPEQFEARYGTQAELLDYVNRRLETSDWREEAMQCSQ